MSVNGEPGMTESRRVVKIQNRAGMHARPAAELVKIATEFRSKITLEKDGLEVNAKSIMGVMMLAAEHGSTLKVCAIGEDSEAAVEAICRLVDDEFGERPEDYELSDPEAEQEYV
jgi:phosphocarrier protein